MFWKKKTSLGLDTGTRCLKAITLRRNADKVKLEGFVFHDLSIANEAYPENVQMAEKLTGLVEGHQLIGREVSLSIENSDIAHLDLSLPEMPRKELEAAISNEVQEQLNLAQEEIAHDYLIEEETTKSSKNYKIKVYWTRRDAVMNRVALVQESKLKPVTLEPVIIAQLTMLGFNGYIQEGKKYLTVDIGESHTSITYHDFERVLFTRNYPAGSGFINTALRENLGCTYQEAELLKVATSAGSGVCVDNKSAEIIRGAYAEILKNIKESFEAASGEATQVSSVLLLGGAGYTVDMTQTIQELVGVPVVVVNPLQNIEIYTKNSNEMGEAIKPLAGYFATSVGLALRGLE